MTWIGTIILAAGESARLGRAKQLVRWGNSTLIRRAVDAAVGASLGPVFVLLGAEASKTAAEISGCAVQIIYNENWKPGMHTSVRRGVEALEKHLPDAEAVILMVCDQPCVGAGTLRDLAALYRASSPPCVASRYAHTLGSPAIFDRSLFDALKHLENGGAKRLIERLGDAVVPYEFPGGEMDIDTSADLEGLLIQADTHARFK